VISTAAGVIVSRVSNEQDVGQQLTGQLFSNPRVMFLTAGIIGAMGIIPGMPHFAFLLLAGAMAWFGRYMLRRDAVQAETKVREERKPAVAAEAAEATWEDVTMVDPLGMEVGYRLITLVDRGQNGELLGRIKSIRKKIAQDIGFLVPVVHIRDNLELKPNAYRITLKGVEIGSGEATPGQWMAINPGQVSGTLPGPVTRDPAFGLPAVWIDASLKEQAQAYGYTVVDASTVVATHLNHLIQMHASELLGRQEVQSLLDRIAKESPKLTEDLVPKTISLTGLQKVLQNLLDEGVPIRDMRTILDVVAEHATKVSEPTELTALVRVALGRAITQQLFPNNADLQVISLDAGLERVLTQALANGGGIEPGLADALLQQAQGAVGRQEQMGLDPVLLVPSPLRPLMARFLRRTLPQLKVLSHAEVPDNRNIRITAMIGGAA
jgi:flagellar biosynthesis protein FlhA